MDPQLQAAMQMLQEAQQIMAMQAEEIQTLRQQGQKPSAQNPGMQKQSSVMITKIASIVGMRETELPEFLKIASEEEVSNFMTIMEVRARQNSIGKIASIEDGSQAETPDERFEAALAGISGN